jgi:hypothetical protein
MSVVKRYAGWISKAVCFVFVTGIFAFCVICQIPNAAAQGHNGATLVCEATRVGEGEIELCLRLDEGELCALAAIMEYNDGEFYFDGASIDGSLADGGGNFIISYTCGDGAVNFIIDGVENAESIVLAKFRFRARRDGAFEFEFCLRGASGVCAAAIGKDGRVGSVKVDFSRAQGRIYTASDSKKPNEIKKPTLMRASMEWEGESDCAELVLPIKTEENCLAAGVKAFVVDTETGKYEVYYLVARAASLHLICYGATVRFCVPVAVNGRLCVVLTPLLYVGNGIVEGEKTLFLINDGTICE